MHPDGVLIVDAYDDPDVDASGGAVLEDHAVSELERHWLSLGRAGAVIVKSAALRSA